MIIFENLLLVKKMIMQRVFSDIIKIIVVNLSKQQALGAEPK